MTEEQRKVFVLIAVLMSEGLPFAAAAKVAGAEYGGRIAEAVPAIAARLGAGARLREVLAQHPEVFAPDAWEWLEQADGGHGYKERVFERTGWASPGQPPSQGPFIDLLQALQKIRAGADVGETLDPLDQVLGQPPFTAELEKLKHLLAEGVAWPEITQSVAAAKDAVSPGLFPESWSVIFAAAEQRDEIDTLLEALLVGAEAGIMVWTLNDLFPTDSHHRLLFYWALLMKYGTDSDRALAILHKESWGGRCKSFLETAVSRRAGQPVCEAMEGFADIFSPGLIDLVRQGESTGTLVEKLAAINVALRYDLFPTCRFAGPGVPRKTDLEHELEQTAACLTSGREERTVLRRRILGLRWVAFVLGLAGVLDRLVTGLLPTVGPLLLIAGAVLLILWAMMLSKKEKSLGEYTYHLEGECIRIRQMMGEQIIE